MKRLFLLITVLTLSIFVSTAQDVDDRGEPNDPEINERANACFGEGSMAGKCDTGWEWICGWHLIRFEASSINREDFAPDCTSLLPPEPLPGTGCIVVRPPAGAYWINFNGRNALPANSPGFANPFCTSRTGSTIGTNVVYAPGGSDIANKLCMLHFGENFLPGGHISVNSIYFCE